jgi:hypothetical protein
MGWILQPQTATNYLKIKALLHSSDFMVFLAALGLAAATPGPGLAAVVATTFEGGAVEGVLVLSYRGCGQEMELTNSVRARTRKQMKGMVKQFTSEEYTKFIGEWEKLLLIYFEAKC